ncbi:hypothetical protein [Sphingopyxis sp. JAI108]|uniref:hypothetical protein n=1 Tax=Sphingopyxis sp. JAI108 TaxID=2723060 RepID=UPI0015C7D68E|nr:hypothetical protein [Sphingopyxis sp. JAI108]NYF33681.1 hypothetical protein [Sphingopyxis sp. JAI108]
MIDQRGELAEAYDEEEWVDEPFADPAIRAEYREALGRFIMAHNEVDFWMSGLLTKAVKILDPDGGLDELAMGDFSQRAANLTLLMKVAPHLALGNAGEGRLAELNGTRNILAHGHFDQDPYEGTFEIVSRRYKTLTMRRLSNLNSKTINAQAEELEAIASHMSSVFDFIDCPVPTEYITDQVMLRSRELWELIEAERKAKPPTPAAPPQPAPAKASAAKGSE